MPFDNLPYGDLAERLGFVPQNHSHAQMYGAEVRPVFDERGEPVLDWNRLVRTDTMQTLEVLPKSYSLIENRFIFGEIETALAQSGLDTAGMIVATDFGGPRLTRCFRQYVLPAHTQEIKPGVHIALRLLFWNSYDGSLRFSGRAGHYSWVCANTSVIGKDLSGFAIKHSGELKAAEAIAGLVQGAQAQVQHAERLQHWPGIGVSDAQAREVICAMDGVSDAQVDHLVHQWVRAKDDDGPQGGANLWALYSALTAWSSHGDLAVGGMAGRESKKGAQAVAVRGKREEQVARVIEAEEWKELEQAGA
jgi:hypothetical protein